MKARYFVTLSAIALTTGLLQLAAQVQQIPVKVVDKEGNFSSRLFLSPYTGLQTPASKPSAILFLVRNRTVLVSKEKDPPPPRPSIPGGSRLRQDLRIRPLAPNFGGTGIQSFPPIGGIRVLDVTESLAAFKHKFQVI